MKTALLSLLALACISFPALVKADYVITEITDLGCGRSIKLEKTVCVSASFYESGGEKRVHAYYLKLADNVDSSNDQYLRLNYVLSMGADYYNTQIVKSLGGGKVQVNLITVGFNVNEIGLGKARNFSFTYGDISKEVIVIENQE